MASKTLPIHLQQTPHSIAMRYIQTIGRAVARYRKKADPIDAQIAELESIIEELKARKEKAKPLIAKVARRFRQFAERHRDEFLRGKAKMVKTKAGDFRWALNQRGLLCGKQDEPEIIDNLIRVNRLDLLRMEIKRKETLAAVDAGELDFNIPVGSRERFVVYPTGQLPVIVCEDDPVRVGKEELEN